MKKLLSLSGIILFLSVPGFLLAQNKVLTLNYENRSIGKGQPLPARESFSITGAIPEHVVMVELDMIRSRAKGFENPDFNEQWTRTSLDTDKRSFTIPVQEPLRGNYDYNLRFKFYRLATKTERQEVNEQLNGFLESYVNQNLTIDKNDIDFNKSVDQMMEELNELVVDAMVYYRSTEPAEFEGFSDLVKGKLEQLRSLRLKVGERLFTDEEERGARAKFFRQETEALKKLLKSEAKLLTSAGLAVLDEQIILREQPTEKVPNKLVIHGGYGAVFFDTEEPNDYDSGIYTGVTIPFGSRTFSGEFWSRMGFIAGVHLTNYEDENGTEWTGPIVGRPVYGGVGYRALEFLRLSAGVTAVEPADSDQNSSLENFDNSVKALPFIGIQVDLQLWIDFLKK